MNYLLLDKLQRLRSEASQLASHLERALDEIDSAGLEDLHMDAEPLPDALRDLCGSFDDAIEELKYEDEEDE